MVNLCSSSQTISEKLRNRYRKNISKLTASHITPFHRRLFVIKLGGLQREVFRKNKTLLTIWGALNHTCIKSL